jgi:hypothetical protein
MHPGLCLLVSNHEAGSEDVSVTKVNFHFVLNEGEYGDNERNRGHTY